MATRTAGSDTDPVRSVPSRWDVDFVKLSPTLNMTLLVRTVHPAEEYRDIATALMSAGHVHAEQVGFVQKASSPGAHARLHMAAGEFCGNACMALAVLNASEQALGREGRTQIVLEASGAENVVRCEVERRDTDYYCRLDMPLPRGAESFAPAEFGNLPSTLVTYDDAVHVIVETDRIDGGTKARAERLAAQLARTNDAPLVAVMVYVPATGQLAPLIHIPALGSLIWESSCGSGTASVGVHLARTTRAIVSANVIQPGGSMWVGVTHERGQATDLQIAGIVSIVAEGKAYIRV
ncbi:hypothetical protein [Arthrobacter sp. CAN_A1]|uniref:hypothetical protein n=1 Tax=Arthrobacter sp. CAN_A1 TaxID=2787717 RepID=UPI0018CB7328